MDHVMFGRPILFFSVVFQPLKPDSAALQKEPFKCNLVYFSAFEELNLPSEAGSVTQQAGNRMLYEPGPWSESNAQSRQPILHVGYAEDVLCRAPLVPCFLDGSSSPTIPASKRREQAHFPHGRCDSQLGEGSLVYEVSMTHWHFGRGKARFMSVDEAEAKRYERRSEGRKKAAETRKRKKRSSKE